MYPKRTKTSYATFIGSSSASGFMDVVHLTQSAPAPDQPVILEMIQQMIIFTFSTLGL